MDSDPVSLARTFGGSFVAGAAPLAIAGVAFPLLQTTVPSAAVSFGPGEITVVGAMITAVTGALVSVFWLLLKSKDDQTKTVVKAKDDQIESLTKEKAGMQLLLSQAMGNTKEKDDAFVQMMQTTIQAATTSIIDSSNAIRGHTETVKQLSQAIEDQRGHSTLEHTRIMDMVSDRRQTQTPNPHPSRRTSDGQEAAA